ncbi:MAG: ureidoglycolate lyase [Ruminiclostridium sp.]
MRKIKAEKITIEEFSPFGSFTSITEPKGSHLGDFYNDKVLFPVSGNMPIAFSSLILHKQEKMIVTTVEYHNSTGEVIVVMDDDVVIHVAPPTNAPVPELTKAFIVPKGTVLELKTGVWHNGCFPINNQEAHVLIVLPERIYMNDCCVVEYKEMDFIEIEL